MFIYYSLIAESELYQLNQTWNDVFNKQHKLIDIITIAISTVIFGTEGWTDIETYILVKYDRLKQLLKLPTNLR